MEGECCPVFVSTVMPACDDAVFREESYGRLHVSFVDHPST